MNGQLTAQLASVAALLVVGAGSVLYMWTGMHPSSEAVRTLHGRHMEDLPLYRALRLAMQVASVAVMATVLHAAGMTWSSAVILGFLVVIAVIGQYRYYYVLIAVVVLVLGRPAYHTQGMMAAQLLAIIVSVAFVGKVRVLMTGYTRHHFSWGSVPLWLVLSAGATVADYLSAPRTLDAVMNAYHLGAFDNPHIPEGLARSFGHEFWFHEQHFMLGLWTPLATTLMLGALAVWSRELHRKCVVLWPFVGWALGALVGLGVALWTEHDVIAAPYLLVGMVLGTVVGVAQSRLGMLLWHFDVSWMATNHEHHLV